jgi:hypothetical protein
MPKKGPEIGPQIRICQGSTFRNLNRNVWHHPVRPRCGLGDGQWWLSHSHKTPRDRETRIWLPPPWVAEEPQGGLLRWL